MSSVQQYPDTFYVIIHDEPASEICRVKIGDSDTDQELSIAHVRAYHKKTGDYSYNLTLVVSSSEGGPALATSDVLVFSNTTTGQTTGHHLVDITFTFSSKYTLMVDETYYFRIESTGYTRDGSTSYLSFWCNWFEHIGSIISAGAKIVLGVER